MPAPPIIIKKETLISNKIERVYITDFPSKCCDDLKIQSDGLAASVYPEVMRVFTILNTTHSGNVQYADEERIRKLWFNYNTWKVIRNITPLSMKQSEISKFPKPHHITRRTMHFYR